MKTKTYPAPNLCVSRPVDRSPKGRLARRLGRELSRAILSGKSNAELHAIMDRIDAVLGDE
jgi:hypothetical protein